MPGCLFACKGLFFLQELCYNSNDPQGDVNTPRYPVYLVPCTRTNSHPARGRKPIQGVLKVDRYSDLTHTPQGDVNSACDMLLKHIKNQLTPRKGTEKNIDRIVFEVFCDLTHTPQGDGKLALFSYSILQPQDLTHTPQGDTTEEPFLLCTNAAEKGSSAFLIFCAVFPTGHGGRAFLWV